MVSTQPITLSNILNEYGGNKFNFNPINTTNEKIYYSFEEVGSSIIYHSLNFIDPICKEKSFFARIPIEYINEDYVNNFIGIEEDFYKIIEKNEEYLSTGRIETSKNKKILIFDGKNEMIVQILLGNKILPIRIFLEPDLNLIKTRGYEKW
jgi:hypothetical protein